MEPQSADGRSKVLVGGIWMDTLLPLMASSAFPKHTKFIVAESDHRFFECEVDALAAASKMLTTSENAKNTWMVPFFGRDVKEQLRHSSYYARASVLPDILRTWTQACRLKKANEDEIPFGYGNFIWFSYRNGLNCSEGATHFAYDSLMPDHRLEAPGIGCFLMGVTGFGAEYMLQH